MDIYDDETRHAVTIEHSLFRHKRMCCVSPQMFAFVKDSFRIPRGKSHFGTCKDELESPPYGSTRGLAYPNQGRSPFLIIFSGARANVFFDTGVKIVVLIRWSYRSLQLG